MYLRDCGSARGIRDGECCVPMELVVQQGGVRSREGGVPKRLVVQQGGLGTEKFVYLRHLWFSKGN